MALNKIDKTNFNTTNDDLPEVAVNNTRKVKVSVEGHIKSSIPMYDVR